VSCPENGQGFKNAVHPPERVLTFGETAKPTQWTGLLDRGRDDHLLIAPSRPGEFHPEPLTDPDVSLSTYPARATRGKLPPSVETVGSSGYPLTQSRPR
jgi:hypothetical protein